MKEFRGGIYPPLWGLNGVPHKEGAEKLQVCRDCLATRKANRIQILINR